MKKKITTMVAATALSVMMAIPAFASNYSGTYLYFDANESYAAPSHAQATITGIDTDDNGNSTDIVVHTAEIAHGGVTGAISAMELGGVDGTAVGDGFLFTVDNDSINSNGTIEASLTISYSGHPVDLSSIYVDVVAD